MTAAELAAILHRLETLGPQRRTSDKHQQLVQVRHQLLALHARGHSWRAIARELTAAGEKVSADLLRAICNAKRKRSAAKPALPSKAHVESSRNRVAPPPTPAAMPKAAGDGRFGARGLKP